MMEWYLNSFQENLMEFLETQWFVVSQFFELLHTLSSHYALQKHTLSRISYIFNNPFSTKWALLLETNKVLQLKLLPDVLPRYGFSSAWVLLWIFMTLSLSLSTYFTSIVSPPSLTRFTSEWLFFPTAYHVCGFSIVFLSCCTNYVFATSFTSAELFTCINSCDLRFVFRGNQYLDGTTSCFA